MGRHRLLRVGHEAGNIAAANVSLHGDLTAAELAVDLRRAGLHADVRHLAQWHGPPAAVRDAQARNVEDVHAILRAQTDPDVKPGIAFDHRADRPAAARLYLLQPLADVHAVARDGGTIDNDPQVGLSGGLLRLHVGRPRNARQRRGAA